MTVLQAIRHLIGKNADVSDERLRITAELLGLDPDAEYTPDMKCLVYKAAISEIQTEKGIKSEEEGGYKITYSDSNIPGVLNGLAVDSGCKELIDLLSNQPKIRNKSFMW